VMGQSVVICTRWAMQRYKVSTAGNLGTLGGAVFNAVKPSSVPETQAPSHTALWRAASFQPLPQTILRGRNGPSPRRQDERQYNQRGQQHARYKRKRRLQWVRLEMAASLC
jgi:hypothetical protein